MNKAYKVFGVITLIGFLLQNYGINEPRGWDGLWYVVGGYALIAFGLIGLVIAWLVGRFTK